MSARQCRQSRQEGGSSRDRSPYRINATDEKTYVYVNRVCLGIYIHIHVGRNECHASRKEKVHVKRKQHMVYRLYTGMKKVKVHRQGRARGSSSISYTAYVKM